jgi:hypothetical protein
MGLIQAYAVYKYGKKKSERKHARERKEQELMCPNCGWELFRHGPKAECPEYS